jgi:hypothetical protein
MDLWYVAAALPSALLHAAWNAAVKANAKPAEIMTAQMVLSALIGVLGFFWTGLPGAVILDLDRRVDGAQSRHRDRALARL